MYAGQIATVCHASASAVSRVTAPLEEAGLVRVRRVGPAKFFSIDERPWTR
jgi:DNA-binding transcriptional ArsR family regulator